MSPVPGRQSFKLANFADMDLDTVQDDKNSTKDDLETPTARQGTLARQVSHASIFSNEREFVNITHPHHAQVMSRIAEHKNVEMRQVRHKSPKKSKKKNKGDGSKKLKNPHIMEGSSPTTLKSPKRFKQSPHRREDSNVLIMLGNSREFLN